MLENVPVLSGLAEVARRLHNRYLVWRFPFLEPRTVDGGRIPGYEYDYTFIDSYPDGWRKVVIRYVKKIAKVLKEYGELENFHIADAKEKYGEARLYHSGISSAECANTVDDLIWSMESDTGHTCNRCGRPAKYVTNGYILPFCKRCLGEHSIIEAREL